MTAIRLGVGVPYYTIIRAMRSKRLIRPARPTRWEEFMRRMHPAWYAVIKPTQFVEVRGGRPRYIPTYRPGTYPLVRRYKGPVAERVISPKGYYTYPHPLLKRTWITYGPGYEKETIYKPTYWPKYRRGITEYGTALVRPIGARTWTRVSEIYKPSRLTRYTRRII